MGNLVEPDNFWWYRRCFIACTQRLHRKRFFNHGWTHDCRVGFGRDANFCIRSETGFLIRLKIVMLRGEKMSVRSGQ